MVQAHCVVVDVWDYCSGLFGMITKNTNLGSDYSTETHYFIIYMDSIV